MEKTVTRAPWGRQDSMTDTYKPSAIVIEATLIMVQIFFGAGSVVGKLGIRAFNPVLFALIREGTAGPILLTLSFVYLWRKSQIVSTRNYEAITDEESLRRNRVPRSELYFPRPAHLWMFVVSGFFIFVNQLGFIVGEKLANATIGSAWQPSQPIMTAVIAILLGWERPTLFKSLGIFVAFGGAAFMVFYKSSSDTGSSPLVGNLLFFVNCAGTAGYVIMTKHIMKAHKSQYTSISVTGWSYMFGSCFMMICGLSINSSDAALKFVCPAKDGEDCASCTAWGVPGSAVGPLLYWILIQSVLCYLMMTWANQYAKASTTVAYTALQPLTSALLSVIIVQTAGKIGGLVMPGINLLGGLGIIAGLILILYDNKRQEAAESVQLSAAESMLRDSSTPEV